MTRLTRAQIRPGVTGIDTSAKGATGLGRAFAPTWDMVAAYKNSQINEAQYTTRYLALLDRVPATAWDTLAQAPTQTLLCFCRDGWFCHTHLIIDFALHHWPDRFTDGRPANHPRISHPVAWGRTRAASPDNPPDPSTPLF